MIRHINNLAVSNSSSTHIKHKTRLLLSICIAFLTFICQNASAYDCTTVQQYLDTSSYQAGDIVQNSGHAYQCTVAGWCSSGGPYAPPSGWAWSNAWNDLGSCNGSGSSGGSSSGGSSSGGSSSGGSSSGGSSSGGSSSGGSSSGGSSSGGSSSGGSSSGGSSSGGSSSGGSSSGGSSSGGSSSGGSVPSGSCAGIPIWEPNTIYNSGNEVQHLDKKYTAKWWTQNQNPATNSDPGQVWTLDLNCGLPSNTPPVEPTCDNLNIDNDQDGIPDCAEEPGKTFYSMPLYDWGARKNQIDLFLEIDYMPVIGGNHSTRPTRKTLERVREVFAANGFHVHIDIGDLFDNAPGLDPLDFDLGGGQEIPFADLIDIPTVRDHWLPLYFANNPERKRIFYYAVFGNRQADTNSSGRAPDFFDYYFFISMGDWGLNTNSPANTNILTNFHASTLTHEWGHTLGLSHGGNPDSNDGGNNKPNYLSSMNYMYQFTGVPKEYVDITRFEMVWDRYQLYQENNYNCRLRLLERCPNNNTLTTLFKAASSSPDTFNFGFSHGIEASINEASLVESSTLGGLDSDCDGLLNNSAASFDLNSNNYHDTLHDHNDWGNLHLYYRHLNYQNGQFQTTPVDLTAVISPASIPTTNTMMAMEAMPLNSVNEQGVLEDELPPAFFNELQQTLSP